MGLTTHRTNKLVTKILTTTQTWTDSVDKRPQRKKMDMRFGTCYVKSMYRAGSLREVAEEILKYKLNLAGVRKVRWDGGGIAPVGVSKKK
jgi:hypothetical protein